MYLGIVKKKTFPPQFELVFEVEFFAAIVYQVDLIAFSKP